MFVQLREPLRSFRRISVIKPLYFRYHDRSSLYPLITIIQGELQQRSISMSLSFRSPYILPSIYLRAYSTIAALNSLPHLDDHSVGIKHYTKPKKNKQDTMQLWDDLQRMYIDSKETLVVKHFELLMTAIIHQAQNMPNSNIQWDHVIQAFELAKALNLQPSPAMYLSSMTAYGHLGNVEKVILTFKDYKKHYRLKSNVYPRYMSAVLNCGVSLTAIRVFRDIKSNPALSSMVKSLCLAELVPVYCLSGKKSHLQMAIRATEEFTRTVPTLENWDAKAIISITQSLWDSYSRLLKLPSSTITPTTIESFISTYIEKSASIIAKSKHNSSHNIFSSQLFTLFHLLCYCPQCVPTVKTCNLILKSMNSNYGEIKSVLACMQKLGVNPDTETISILLCLFGTNLSIEQSKKLYQALKQQDMPDNKVNLNICKAFIKVFSQDPTSVNLAQNVAMEMKRSGHELDAELYATMAHGFVKYQDISKGWNWLQKSGCKNLDAYAILIEGWLERGQWNQCILQYNALQNQFGQNTVDTHRRLVKSLLTAHFAGNNFAASDILLSSELKIKFTPNTVMRIINTLLNLKNKNGHSLVPGDQIVKALKMMESKLHVYLDAEGISHAIIGLGNRGDCEDSYRLYRWIREKGHEAVRKRCGMSSIYRAMIDSATKNNDISKLERAWVDMQYRKRYLGKGDLVKQPPNLAAFNMLFNGYASRLPMPDLTRIKRAFRRMLKLNLNPDLVTYNILIKAFVNSDKMEAAFQLFEDMAEKPGIQPDIWTINTLLKAWIDKQNWTLVERFIVEIKKLDHIKLDIATFNLFVQSFLQLDSQSMSYAHLLKYQNKWTELERFKNSKSYALTSDTIWEIFETTTGYSRSLIQTSSEKVNLPSLKTSAESTLSLCDQLSNVDMANHYSRIKEERAFVKLFSGSTEADEVTYKLFMKAFVNAGDYKSASKIHHWMSYRLRL
ncbi:MAG: hypothetical protein EXX96DRAFT_333749 [Benjaminiella poitrasii]|nr:MAG: hypothetical protein EXX96DRAFT_333749 [Benjaminiella poitrasii]